MYPLARRDDTTLFYFLEKRGKYISFTSPFFFNFIGPVGMIEVNRQPGELFFGFSW